MITRYTLPKWARSGRNKTNSRNGSTLKSPFAKCTPKGATIPVDALEQIKSRASFSVERINEIEKTTNHDVIAFTTNLAESIGEASRFVHYGLTSSDVVDTANALLLRDASEILLKKIEPLMEALKRRAFEVKLTPHKSVAHMAFTLNLRHSV